MEKDFSQFGLAMTRLYINAITPPSEVQKAIDDKSRMEVFDTSPACNFGIRQTTWACQ